MDNLKYQTFIKENVIIFIVDNWQFMKMTMKAYQRLITGQSGCESEKVNKQKN